MIRLTRAAAREIDRLAAEEYHLPTLILMENAARAVADSGLSMLGSSNRGALILCGGGNNGGDGLAAARHLHNRGVGVTIGLTVDPAQYRGDALIHWRITCAMKLPASPVDPATILGVNHGLIIDAIFGTGLSHAPRAPFSDIAAAIEKSNLPVLAVDIPSGFDCDTGVPPGACVRATRTLTFVAEKIGFAAPGARQFLGEVLIGDIGCPRELIERVAASSQGKHLWPDESILPGR